MQMSAKEEQSDPRGEIWAIINSVLGDLTLSENATNMFEKLIVSGIDRVRFDQDHEARALEAYENYRYLAQTVLENVAEVKSIVGVSDVNAALAAICPLYPIC